MKIRTLSLLGIILVFVNSNLIAEEASPKDSANSEVSSIGTENTKKDAIEVVVTASRGQEQDPLNVPQAITSISRSELDRTDKVDVDEILRQLPNVGMAPAEGNPNYWQEGFTIRGLGAQRVLTLSDGIRQAGQGIGYGGGNLSLYSPFSIDRIEVLRGPASVLYGTDAFGGVVNIITREPRERTEFGTNGGIGYNFDGGRDMNRMGAYLDAGDDKIAAIGGFSFTNSGEPNLPDGEDPKSGSFRNIGAWGKVDFNISPDTKFRLIGNNDRTSDVLVTDDSMSLPIATFPPPGSSEIITSPLLFQFPVYQRSVLGGELTAENVSPVVEYFKTGVYWQRLYRQFHRESAYYPLFSPGFAGPPTFVNPAATVNQSVVDTYDRTNTYEWQTQSLLDFEPHKVTVGFDLGYDTAYLPETETNQVVGRAGFGSVFQPATTESRVRADATQLRAGIYTQDNWDLDPFELTPGIRFDYHGVEDEETSTDEDVYGLSGSLGSLYHFSDRTSGYLNLASGYRAPDLGERFQDGIVNLGAPSRVIGNPDLDPERSYSAELGTKHRGRKFDVESAIFTSRIQDFIATESIGVVQGFSTEQYNNVGTVNLWGLEAAGRVRLTDKWGCFANGGRTFTEDDDVIDVPNFIFNYGTDYKIPVGSEYVQTVTPAILFRSALDSKDKTATGGRTRFEGSGYTVVDLKVSIDIGKTELGRGSIIGGIRNLFDKAYKEPFFTLSQPERSGFVGVQFDF